MRVQAVAICYASITIHAQCIIIGVELEIIMKFMAREEYIIHIYIYTGIYIYINIYIYIIHIPKDK